MIALLEAIEIAVQEADRPLIAHPQFEGSVENPMFKWHERLKAATSEQEVVAIVREYVATLTEGDLARLPPPCRPGKIDNAKDVRDFSFALVRHDCVSDGATARLITRMSDFFSRAEGRLMEITSK